MSALRMVDVRADVVGSGVLLPRRGDIRGIAVHHSATANQANGLALDDARSIFEHQVLRRGWAHGGYHYCIRPNGVIEYCLDEDVAGYHAGFSDPDDVLGLEYGQYWNEHFLAICVIGWFERQRVLDGRAIPDHFVTPTRPQWESLVGLVTDLRARHAITPEAVLGHRELDGCATRCPGNLDLHALRATQG